MKKILSVLLCILLLCALLPGCTKSAEVYALAMVTDTGSLDDKAFNQGTWEGLKRYADEHSIACQYYKPAAGDNGQYYATIEMAVKGGAEVVVVPGMLFETAVHQAQAAFPEVKFICIDGRPHAGDKKYDLAQNTFSILYAEEQAGFLAGYAAVKDGFTKLGFQGGMGVPSVTRFGYGFVQGADAAAKALGLTAGAVEINYNYSGDFLATPETQSRAAGWYESGTEIIFACGGSVGNSVMAAAEAGEGRYVVGVDTDQSGESETVICSAIKSLEASVYDAIAEYYSDSFEGGTVNTLSVANDGVGLAMENARWRSFSAADYATLYEDVKNGVYAIDSNYAQTLEQLAPQLVSVTMK